jgi:hypothetical protein
MRLRPGGRGVNKELDIKRAAGSGAFKILNSLREYARALPVSGYA